MMIMKKFKQSFAFDRIASIAPAAAGLAVSLFAAATNAASMPKDVISSSDDVVKIFCAGLAWMFWGLIVLGIAMFFVGGYIYATAQGNSEKVSQATKTLTYAAIAIAIAIVARGVPILIGSFFGGSVNLSTLQVCG